MGKPNTTEKAAGSPQPAVAEKKTPKIVVSEGTVKPVRKNVLTEPKKVSKDVHGNKIEER